MPRLMLLAGALALVSAPPASPTGPSGPDGRAAFRQLVGLAGEWEGTVTAPDGPAVRVRWEKTAGGHVMRETMFPGTGHEMVTMYHLDGDALVLTHYCATGNQPRMKLVAATPGELSFDYTGGTNLDAARDRHMHSGRLMFKDADRIETDWTEHAHGQPTVHRKFFLARKK
jgi:hypothetical protein